MFRLSDLTRGLKGVILHCRCFTSPRSRNEFQSENPRHTPNHALLLSFLSATRCTCVLYFDLLAVLLDSFFDIHHPIERYP